MRLFSALICLLLACLIGYFSMTLGVDRRGEAWAVSDFYIYIFVVVFALPFWLFLFLPLYFLVPSKSIAWRWYIAPIIGVLVGFVGSLILADGRFDIREQPFLRIYFAPAIVGFFTFLLGFGFKSQIK